MTIFTDGEQLPLRLTILSSMAGSAFEDALDRHVAWGIRDLDLKDGIYGKSIAEMSLHEAERAVQEISSRGLNVWCLSSTLFHDDVAIGEEAFRARALAPLTDLIATAKILGPRFIRLLTPQCAAAGFGERVTWVEKHASWLWDAFREAIDMIRDGGFECTIENETESPIIDGPESALAKFECIGSRQKVSLTWDVQNMWQAGTFPSLEVYEKLRPLIGYYHIKGGQSEVPGGPLVWRSSLADASWPVREITERVIADGHSPVICLNPSHGASESNDYVDYTEADIAWMRETFPRISSPLPAWPTPKAEVPAVEALGDIRT